MIFPLMRVDFVRSPTCLIFRVKFGVPLDQVCNEDLPGPLLVIFKDNPNEQFHKNYNLKITTTVKDGI